MMTRSMSCIAELKARIAELEKENEKLKNDKNKDEDECVWVYAWDYDIKFYFKTEEEAYEWWEWYKTKVGNSIEGDIVRVWKHDPDGQARFKAEFINEDGSTDEDTDDEDEEKSLQLLQIIDHLCNPDNRDAALKLLEKEGVLPKNMMTHLTE